MSGNQRSRSNATGEERPFEPTIVFSDERPQSAESVVLPERIGRYRVEKLLGKGGFGLVYLAHDDQLQRLVAIKVPHARLVARAADAEAYLKEARTVASLDHPHIVPVFDVGSTEQFPCFIVSKHVDGCDLATMLTQSRLSLIRSVELAVTVAEALHYAHKKGLVHRDIKPGNILVDRAGKPYVTDFGLALRERETNAGPRYAGTPAYMSPEQARGEGHRVDGRSDTFSLGVVLYELLTGHHPFVAESHAELLDQIATVDPRPPRQLDDSIPRELDRICLKAMAKRASERYSTMQDLADDLRQFLAAEPARERAEPTATPVLRQAAASHIAETPSAAGATPTSENKALVIVPKGLRSFDHHDADFFLELLPGPRDRHGLPDSIRLWKTWIEESDPARTFTVGLLCGASGCGKSSLMKAGLLPRLADRIRAVYIESTADDTEDRLQQALRARCRGLPSGLGLKQTLAALRHGEGLEAAEKVLIVLDQFEQWLHANRERENTELVQALRQCDGTRLQAIVMVRDDFWMAIVRFMRELEVRLAEGQNYAAVDLFPLRHAEKVLRAFGRSFGAVPERDPRADKQTNLFLKQAVAGLAEEGKVSCVRLALFAEMMKAKVWTLDTLREVGGAEGVGVTFLEETFSSAQAAPQHRYHQKAARAVLKALLPDAGADIKGHLRSRAELLEASGYAARPADFDELIQILDNELRLITPADADLVGDSGSLAGTDASDAQSAATRHRHPARFYQLTHDYLVPSLRSWLTRKQKETRAGRAELLLADRAAIWNTRPENRQLPTWLQWLLILWLTRRQNWTAAERKMMARANRHHSVRGLAATMTIALLAFAGLRVRHAVLAHTQANRADELVERLVDADIAQVPSITGQIAPYRQWADRKLRELIAQADRDENLRSHLRASLALAPVDSSQADYLLERLLDAEPEEVPVIRDALSPPSAELIDNLWKAAEGPEKGNETSRLPAAAGLAKYDPDNARWSAVAPAVANDLVVAPTLHLGIWLDALRPVQAALVPSLASVFRDSQRPTVERLFAANILTDYAADQPELLADLLMDADERLFGVMYPIAGAHGERAWRVLTAELDRQAPVDGPEIARERLAKRQANAAVALLKLNQPDRVWPLLRHSSDPRRRSYLIHRFGPFGVGADVLVERLSQEPESEIRRALILSLGPEEYPDEMWNADHKQALIQRLKEIYTTDDDPGMHAAAEWLLRQWREEAWIVQTVAAWSADKRLRDRRLEGISTLLRLGEKATPQWYVTGQGQTMVVLPGPVEFTMGSPETEFMRRPDESLHQCRIGRSFAMMAAPVTIKQFHRFEPDYTNVEIRRYPEPSCPIGGLWASHCADYCNWLSEQEGIPRDQWCYNVNENNRTTSIKQNYMSLIGYRLPSEAEFEYACRAGALTARYYGQTEELLGKYAWNLQNARERTWPVGNKKPNDFGLFDMHGHVYTWCQQGYVEHSAGEGLIDDVEDYESNVPGKAHALRGGSITQELDLRSAYRIWMYPTVGIYVIGLRPVRTIR
jgi:eukaryotic-like serine/threonine-protein kinase